MFAEERAAAANLRAACDAARVEVATLRGSLSWRVTRPLRCVWDFAAGLAPFLREMRGFPQRAHAAGNHGMQGFHRSPDPPQ